MKINVKTIGHFDHKPVYEAILRSETGVVLSVLSYGGVIRHWRVPVHNKSRQVTLGFESLEAYLSDEAHIGALVGRVANRTSGAQWSLNSRVYQLPANAGKNHLHGGPKGIGRQNWSLDTNEVEQSVILTLRSPDGDMGYPGQVDFQAVYSLKDYKLRLEMTARVSEVTPVSMVQHNYFNLMGMGSVLDHQIKIEADTYTPLSEELVPTGEFRDVGQSFYDLRQGRTQRTPDGSPQAYDINYVLNPDRDKTKREVAILTAPDESLVLKLWTDQPGLQFYNGYYLNAKSSTLNGEAYTSHNGLCLEDQMFPDAMNQPGFPSILVTPEKDYSHWCEIEIK